MLTDELISNIAARYGQCGHDWYITEDTGGARYLYLRDQKDRKGNGFTYPILLHPAILRHLGLLPDEPKPDEPQPDDRQDQPDDGLPSRDTMLLQIHAYCNTHTASERQQLLSQCHDVRRNIDDLSIEDVTRLYNILKLKGYKPL